MGNGFEISVDVGYPFARIGFSFLDYFLLRCSESSLLVELSLVGFSSLFVDSSSCLSGELGVGKNLH